MRLREPGERAGVRSVGIDETNARIDGTNRELSELKDEVRTGFAELQRTLAKNIRWMAAVLLGLAMAVLLTVALL